MKRTQQKTQRGFTLPEMMISIVASGILMLTVMNLMGLSTQQWGKGNDLKDLTQELALSLENIANEVKAADADTVPGGTSPGPRTRTGAQTGKWPHPQPSCALPAASHTAATAVPAAAGTVLPAHGSALPGAPGSLTRNAGHLM